MWKFLVPFLLAVVLAASSCRAVDLPKIRNPYQMMNYIMKNLTENVEDPYEYADIAQIFIDELKKFRLKPYMKLVARKPTKLFTFAKRFTKPLPKEVEKAFENYIAVSKINNKLDETCSQSSVDLLEELRARTSVMENRKECGSHELDNWGKVDRFISLIMIEHGVKCQPFYEQRFISRLEHDTNNVMQAVDFGHKFLQVLLGGDLSPDDLDENMILSHKVDSWMNRLNAVDLDKVATEISRKLPVSVMDKRRDPRELMHGPCTKIEKSVGPNLFSLVDYDYTYSMKIAKYELRVKSLPYKYAWLGYKMCKMIIEDSVRVKQNQ